MLPDFDVIVVGSGPAGVSAAYPLVQSGLRVLMVDGGRQGSTTSPSQDHLVARSSDPEQWEWMVGKGFYALQEQAFSPKLRAPNHRYVFEDFLRANRITPQTFVTVGSLATGGLSNAWGCGVARLSEAELSAFPFDSSAIIHSYEAVARRVGISGRNEDDLSTYFGLDAWSQPPIEMDALHTYLQERYARRKPALETLRFRLGRSRVAVLRDDQGGRLACARSGNCLWGCHRRALYTAADELPALKSHGNFQHDSGFVVEHIARTETDWQIQGKHCETELPRSATAGTIVLAAGTLATTRLALEGLQLKTPVRLLSCPTAAFLLWIPSLFGRRRTHGFGLGQLSFSVTTRDGTPGFGSTFATTGIPVSDFARRLPLGRRHGIGLLRALLSSCLVGNIFLPGDLTAAQAVLSEHGSLTVAGDYDERVGSLMAELEVQLRQVYWHMGAVLVPTSFTLAPPGADIHYAGTLPMRESPAIGETTREGELAGLNGVYVVDGACLPALSEKSHTLTIMANADRIGRTLAVKLLAAHEKSRLVGA